MVAVMIAPVELEPVYCWLDPIDYCLRHKRRTNIGRSFQRLFLRPGASANRLPDMSIDKSFMKLFAAHEPTSFKVNLFAGMPAAAADIPATKTEPEFAVASNYLRLQNGGDSIRLPVADRTFSRG